MEAICEQCKNPFDAVRSTARFCSDVCRVNSHRGSGIVESIDPSAETETVEKNTPENSKPVLEGQRVENGDLTVTFHCPRCVTFESGVHWCPNQSCSCFETREEQLASIAESEAGAFIDDLAKLHVDKLA